MWRLQIHTKMCCSWLSLLSPANLFNLGLPCDPDYHEAAPSLGGICDGTTVFQVSSRLIGYITWNLPAEHLAQCPARGEWKHLLPPPLMGTTAGTVRDSFFPPTAKCHTEARGYLLGCQGRIPGCPRSTHSFPQSLLKPLLCPRQQTVLEVPQGQDRAPGITERPLVKNTPCNYRLGKLPCRDRAGHCAGRSQGGQGRPPREGHPKIVC